MGARTDGRRRRVSCGGGHHGNCAGSGSVTGSGSGSGSGSSSGIGGSGSGSGNLPLHLAWLLIMLGLGALHLVCALSVFGEGLVYLWLG